MLVMKNVKTPTESLPTRECGLKCLLYALGERSRPSLPTRECGLKWVLFQPRMYFNPSLPTRECGLK